MDLHLNLNHRDIITIRDCCSFEYLSNQNMLTVFFDKKIDRTIAINDLNRSNFAPNKIVEYDNSDYSDLPECYKFTTYFNYPIILKVSE